MRIGFGYDVHRYAENRDFILGGIKIPYHLGLKGHSDADALLHAICDSILGALNLRDIGFHFPDTSAEYKNVDSKILLEKTFALMREKNYKIGNIDSTIVAEEPKMNPHIPKMQSVIAKILNCEEDQVSIKATTNEKMGFVGQKEGIACYVVCLLEKN